VNICHSGFAEHPGQGLRDPGGRTPPQPRPGDAQHTTATLLIDLANEAVLHASDQLRRHEDADRGRACRRPYGERVLGRHPAPIRARRSCHDEHAARAEPEGLRQSNPAVIVDPQLATLWQRACNLRSANAGHAPRRAHYGGLPLTRGAPSSGDRASTSRYPLVSALSVVVGALLGIPTCAHRSSCAGTPAMPATCAGFMIADAVRYMSVDSCREPDSAGLRCTSHPANNAPREPENTQARGRFRW